jgi:hypothetical protein
MKKRVIVTRRNGHALQKGYDTKTNWPTDRRSQYNLNLNLKLNGAGRSTLARSQRSRYWSLLSLQFPFQFKSYSTLQGHSSMSPNLLYLFCRRLGARQN